MDQEHSQLIVPSTDDVARINGRRRLLKGLAAGAAGLGALSMAASASAYTPAQDAVDVSGGGDGYGLHAGGGLAAIRLKPASAGTGAPSNGGHQNGEFYVDSNGSLYYSVRVDGSGNGTWRKLAVNNAANENAANVNNRHAAAGALFFLPGAGRVVQATTNATGNQIGVPAGGLTVGTPFLVQVTGVTGNNGGQVVPAGATAIMGSVYATNQNVTGRVKILPSGISDADATGNFGTANIAYFGSASAPAGAFGFFVAPLDNTGKFKMVVLGGFNAAANLFVDIYAYFI